MRRRLRIAAGILLLGIAACTPHGPPDDVYARWYGATYEGGHGGNGGGGGGGM